jgi:hypothetical protein
MYERLTAAQKVNSSSDRDGPLGRRVSGPSSGSVADLFAPSVHSVRLSDELADGNAKKEAFAGTSEAADGTRTHDLLHGNRLRFPHKRLVLRFSPESDYRGLPGIRPLLVPQWSPVVRVSAAGLARPVLRN